MLNLKNLLPDYYDGVREMNVLIDAEQWTFGKFDDQVERLTLNKFVSQADSQGLSIFENQLGIETDLSKSLESRRYDILIRLLPPHPITFKYFLSLIDSFNIPTEVQRDVYTEVVNTYSDQADITSDQLDRLKYMLNVYLPANMAYQINVNSDVRSELPIYMDTVTTISATTIVKPKLQWYAKTDLPMKFNSVTQLYSETTVRPKEV